MRSDMKKMILAALLVLILVAITGAGAIGYELGYSHGLSQINLIGNLNQPASSSVLGSSNPFSFTFGFVT